MKILQITPAFYPARGYGGGPKVVYEISKRLVKKGHPVTVFTTDADDKHSRFGKGIKDVGGIETHYFENISNFLAFEHKIFLSPGMISIMRKELKNFDIVHLHDTRTLQSIIAYYFVKKYGISYVLQPHGTLTSQTRKKQRFKKIFDIFLGIGILKNASKLIVLNETEAKKCREMGVNEEQIEIIPNGINLSGYGGLPEKGVFREMYKIGADHRIILYLGRIHESKGIELLVRAFADLSKKLDAAKLVIVGPDDGHLSILEKMANSLSINDMVLFTGSISEEDKLAAYVDADVFVTPSFYGFPLTFLEAMACGVPIVTTDKGDYIDGINNEIGFVVLCDEQQLENALFKILTNGDLKEKFSENAKKKVEDYSWEKIADEIEKVYERVINNSKH